MTETSSSIILMWHDLALSEKRAIAAQFGVSPCGAKSMHQWTLQIIDAAISQDRIADFKAAVRKTAMLSNEVTTRALPPHAGNAP
jgi:hypothetical protein